MGRGGFHGLATDHLDDVDFINIQPVVKTCKTERGLRRLGRRRETGVEWAREAARVYKSRAARRGVGRYYALPRFLVIRFKTPV